MHAHICDPQDAAAVARLRAALRELGAEALGHDWAIGVDLWTCRVGGNTLKVFSDAWSVDIEGPAEMVQRIVAIVRGGQA